MMVSTVTATLSGFECLHLPENETSSMHGETTENMYLPTYNPLSYCQYLTFTSYNYRIHELISAYAYFKNCKKICA